MSSAYWNQWDKSYLDDLQGIEKSKNEDEEDEASLDQDQDETDLDHDQEDCIYNDKDLGLSWSDFI